MLISTPRVTQLDAFLLDNELVSHLLDQVAHATSTVHKREVSLVLKALLYKLTLWDKNQSYGMFLMNLKYENLKKWKKLGYFSWIVLGPYLNERVSERAYDDDQGEQWQRLWKLGEKAIKVSEFLNTLVFLVKGDYPTLAMRLLSIRISVNSIELARANKGNISYEFQNRQLVWNTFLEFIIFILPMLKNSGLNRVFSRLLQKPSKVQDQIEFKHLKERECAICLSNGEKQRITVPYQGSCGCKYCYVCITTELEQSKTTGDTWHCLKCGEPVTGARPFVDVDTKAIKLELQTVDTQEKEKFVDDESEDGEETRLIEDDLPEDYDEDGFEQDEFDEVDDEGVLKDDPYDDDL